MDFRKGIAMDKEFDTLAPKAFTILMDAEEKFFDALEQLRQKHSSLTTVEQIDKLTKEILKLCK